MEISYGKWSKRKNEDCKSSNKTDQPVITEMQITITKELLKVATNTHNNGFGNDFLDVTSEAQVTKVQIAKLDYIKIKIFWVSKDIINRVKREPIEWEIFVKHVFDKGLISSIYKELQINKKHK